MAPKESRIQRNIQLALRKRWPKSWWMKIHGGPFQPAGVPDLIGCVSGRFFALEVKRPTGVVSPIQTLTIEKMIEAGGCAAVVYSAEEAVAIVEQALHLPKKRR